MLASSEPTPHSLPCGLLVLAGRGLHVLHPAKVDGDLTAGAEPDDLLLHLRLAEPRDAVLFVRSRLLQLSENLPNGLVAPRRREDQCFEVLGNEDVALQALL